MLEAERSVWPGDLNITGKRTITVRLFYSDPVRLRDDLRGCVSTGAAVRACQQRDRAAPGRVQTGQVLPALTGTQGAGHRRLVQHPQHLRLYRRHQQRTYGRPA